jgi:hypothetical protein
VAGSCEYDDEPSGSGATELVNYRRGTSRVLLHAVKSYDMGPSDFTFHPRGRCAADFYCP